MASADSGITIDELAARSGAKTSTIRMYQHDGLLPPPVIRGRVGYYGEGHIARLELIGRLQQRGYTLAAIKDLIESWEQGRDLTTLLGLEQAVVPNAGGKPIHLSLAELTERFAGVELDAKVMQRAVRLGLVELEDDGVRVPEPRFLEIGSELLARGLTPNEVLDEWERVATGMQSIAERFGATFDRHVWQPFVARGMPDNELHDVTESLERMHALGTEIVMIALQRALAATAERAVAATAESRRRREHGRKRT